MDKIKSVVVITFLLLFSLLQTNYADDPKLYKLPSGPDSPGTFGAYYAHLEYSPEWDEVWRVGDHPDIVVRFDDGGHKFVFWRGTSYIPCWVTDTDIWYTNEFVERRGIHCANTDGCVEPMSDKQCRYSQVRIIESNDARVVVHWRYAPVDVQYEHSFIDQKTGWFDWVDEYYTIYPNASGVREITVQSSGLYKWIEFQEGIVVNQPGTLPHDNIEAGAISISNMKGEHKTYYWDENGGPVFDENPEGANILTVNLKSERRPYALVAPPKKGNNLITSYGGHGRNSIFNWWDHWPVSQDASDGRGAESAERPSHSSLFHIGLAKDHAVDIWGSDGYATVIRNGILEWTSTERSGLNLEFDEPMDLNDSVLISFDYADLWTSDITLTFNSRRGGATGQLSLNNFGDKLTLNDPDLNTFSATIYLPDYKQEAKLSELTEAYMEISGSEEHRTWKLANLKISAETAGDQKAEYYLDFDMPDGSSVEDMKKPDKAEWEPYSEGENTITKLMLHGMTSAKVQDLVPLAKSWVDAPELMVEGTDFVSNGYDPTQMAYVIGQKSASDNTLKLKVKASENSPLINPAFVIKGWDKSDFELKVNNEKLKRGEDYRYGIEKRLDGTDLILWINKVYENPVSIMISKS